MIPLARTRAQAPASIMRPSQTGTMANVGRSLMMDLLRNIQKLAWWKRLVISLMLLLIVLTWLAVCLILRSYLVS